MAEKKEVKKKEVKAPVEKLKGNPTDVVKVECVKAYGKLVKDKVYSVSIDVANALISKKLVKKA
jgi:hypothetical protein